MKIFGIFVGVFLLFITLVVGIDQAGFAYGVWNTTFWGSRQANAERQVFVNTNSYIQGKTDYISRLRYEYQTADEGHKAGLRTLILSEASNVDINKLPVDLQGFIQNLRNQ